MAAVVQNIGAGLIAGALIVIAAISYAQEHQECWSGHIIKPCGSVTPSIWRARLAGRRRRDQSRVPWFLVRLRDESRPPAQAAACGHPDRCR
ncbi:hypothetical protein XH93_21485 [Bradyrhizobium sp. CCBAU 51753]|nr:hypothetical protein XH93_21485 [Bradyrhizobium sp. CCBAU 51753]